MATDIAGMIGGAMIGLTQGKNEAQQRQLMDEYKKNQSDLIKIEAKYKQAQIDNMASEDNLLKWAMSNGRLPVPGSSGEIPGQPFPGAPSPVPPGQFAPQSLPGPGGVLGREIAPPNNSPLAVGTQPPKPLVDLLSQQQIKAPSALMFANVNPNAATGLAGLASEYYSKFGEPLKVTDAYRTRDQQADVYARKPNLAAPPGYSNHEKGLAFDIDPAQADKLDQSGLLAKYGFNRPMLGQGASGKNEPWHIELAGGQPQQVQAPGPQMAGQPVQFSGGLPQPGQMVRPQQNLLTPEKVIEGLLFKKYHIQPDEVQYVTQGDHKIVATKRGQILGIIAGQGKMEMVDYTLPDGSVIKKPVLMPPSPVPNIPGVPVFNWAGQTQANMMGEGGSMIKPPTYNYQDVKTPSGATNKIAVPQAQPGFSFQAEPSKIETQEGQGIPVADVGRVNMIMHAESKLNDINQMLLPGGKINRELVMKASAPMGGIGEGTTLYSRMYQAVDAALRLETGAQANADEIKVKMQEYWPSIKDTDEAIRNKNKDLNEYIRRTVNLHDPTGKLRELGKKQAAGGPSMMGAPPAGANKRLRFNPQTGQVEPIQ